MDAPISQHVIVTAAYSNALFHATFPVHADFHQRFHSIQLTPAMIKEVRVPDIYPHPNTSLILTNGDQSSMTRGIVGMYRSSRDFFFKDWNEPLEKFVGRSLITTNEAFQVATNMVLRLGYTMEQFATNWQLSVNGPFLKNGLNIPFVSFTWQSQEDEWQHSEIHVDMERKQITYIYLPSRIRGTEPKVSVVPETLRAYRERLKQTNGFLNISTNK